MAEGYSYIDADLNQENGLRTALEAILDTISLVELDLIQEVAGAATGRPAPVHYVVETAVLPEAEADCAAWVFEDHLPGLAAVPCRAWCASRAIATPVHSTAGRARTPSTTWARAIRLKARPGSRCGRVRGRRVSCRCGEIPGERCSGGRCWGGRTLDGDAPRSVIVRQDYAPHRIGAGIECFSPRCETPQAEKLCANPLLRAHFRSG